LLLPDTRLAIIEDKLHYIIGLAHLGKDQQTCQSKAGVCCNLFHLGFCNIDINVALDILQLFGESIIIGMLIYIAMVDIVLWLGNNAWVFIAARRIWEFSGAKGWIILCMLDSGRREVMDLVYFFLLI
ncbi:hypothetical protein ACJX0J_012808, partial [Zea mays]